LQYFGEGVATLVSVKLSTGKYVFKWDAGRLASGVYYCMISAGTFKDVGKMVLLSLFLKKYHLQKSFWQCFRINE